MIKLKFIDYSGGEIINLPFNPGAPTIDKPGSPLPPFSPILPGIPRNPSFPVAPRKPGGPESPVSEESQKRLNH